MTPTIPIRVRDIGPVTEFEYEVDSYGLHVLKGDQGCGKSTTLRCIQLAVDGRVDVKPTKRDGTPRGEAEVGGKKIRITKTTREEGELNVDGLGDLSIADLHSPKFQEAHIRDKHRIKTLLRLLGVNADASMFFDLVGGEEAFYAIVDRAAIETDDLVEMAAKVKRGIERSAAAKESQLETALANMRAKASIAEGVDLTAPCGESELQQRLQSAIEARARLVQQRNDALRVLDRAAKAKEQLVSAPTAHDVAAAEETRIAAKERRIAIHSEVVELKEKLSEAMGRLGVAEANCKAAEDASTQLVRAFDTAEKWREDVRIAENVDCPTEDVIRESEGAVAAANQAVKVGVVVRNALVAKAEAEHYAEHAKAIESGAKRLRAAAKSIQEVLANAARVEGCPIELIYDDNGDARLVVATDRSPHEPFDDLSDGERWILVMRLAAHPNRLLVLPQAAYGELTETSRRQIHELAVKHECFVVTALADDGELRGEPYVIAQETMAA